MAADQLLASHARQLALMDAAMDAEQALLGAMLTDVRAQHAVLGLVSPEDFYRPWHGQVLAAMQRLDARGVVPGPVEVYAELKRDPELPRSVSHDAVPLADLLHAAPRASHASAHAGIVIGAEIRRRLSLGGGRMRQAGETTSEPVDDLALEAARWVVSQAHRDAEACGQRWRSLPYLVRRELPGPGRDSGTSTEIGWRARQVRDELTRLREDLWAEDMSRVADRLAAVAQQLARSAARSAHESGRRDQMMDVASRPEGKAAEAAGLAALRDLVANPSFASDTDGWLQPGHFARPRHGIVYKAITDMRRAGMPIDPVTVSWEVARRGVTVEPRELAGGCGAFTAASTAQVYRRGILAQVQRVGLDIQADAGDARLPTATVIQHIGDQLAAVERDLAPERCRVPHRGADVVALVGRQAIRSHDAEASAEHGWEAAQ